MGMGIDVKWEGLPPPSGNLGFNQNGINLPPGYDTPEAIINHVRTYCQQQAVALARQGACGGGGKSKVQKGGASGTGVLAWGITAAIITGTTFAAYEGWGAAESVLVGEWFIPKLCTGWERVFAAFGWGARGAQSCAVRETRYAWLARILAVTFLTSGGALATKFNPVVIQQWVKGKLDNFLAFITHKKKEKDTCSLDDEQLMNEWLAMQNERFYDIETEKQMVSVAAAPTAPAAAAAGSSWGDYWASIVAQANVSSGGGKRRKSRRRKNKKSKRKMAKRKASKRRRNKRNKTRR
jgi:hypothetical protein